MDNPVQWPSFEGNPTNEDTQNSHLIINNGSEYAGQHLILDVWGASNLNNIEFIEQCFRQCIKAANATLLHIHLHHFTQGDGVSGVAVLAESHISIHTWPEKNYAAFDVFMCGEAKPLKVVPILLEAFEAKQHKLTEILRGDMSVQAL
jgi:S-adenosylmethionine decarboxylase